MTESIELNATLREETGKAGRRLAGTGRLPAVVYGVGHEAQAVSVDRHEFEQLLHHGGLTSSVVKLSIDGHKSVNVIVKSMQNDPLKGTVQHVDFWAINMRQTIATTVPIHFVGESAGVKTGGVIMHNLREVHTEALPANLPEYIEADITALEVGDSLHVSDLTVPEGVTITSPADEIVASVMAPKAEEAEEVSEEAPEPEVIGEKPESE